MKKILFPAGLLGLATFAGAQEGVVAIGNWPGSHLVICIIGGIALAIAFQLVLTNLSLAGGLTAIGSQRGKKADKKNSLSSEEHSEDKPGHAYRLASGGMRSAAGTVKGVLGGSERSKASAIAHDTMAAVREELFDQDDPRNMRKAIVEVVEKLRTPQLDYKRLRKEVEKVLEDTGVAALAKTNSLSDEHIANLEVDIEGSSNTPGRLKRTVKEVIESMKSSSSGSRVNGALDSVGRLSGDEEFRTRWEQYLRNTHKEQLDPESIKAELELLLHDPRAGLRALRQRLSTLDRESIQALIEQRQDIEPEQSQRIVDNVMKIRARLTGHYERVSAGVGEKISAAQDGLRSYVRDLNRPELSYEEIAAEFQQLLHDPKAGYQALRTRLGRMDRDTIKAIVMSRPGMDLARLNDSSLT